MAVSAAGIQLHQYASGTIGGLRVATDYPWSEDVTVRAEEPQTVSLRLPAWAEGATLGGQPVQPGYVTATGTEFHLRLPLTPRWTEPDPRVDAVRGCVAAERGPLVYCLESTDQECADLNGVRVDVSDPPTGDLTAPGEFFDDTGTRAATLNFTPYHAWGNRGPSTMRVWTPKT